MSTIVVELKKRRYVCGLFWQSLSRPRELKAEAIELAHTLNLDLMVLRKAPGVAQAGYASSREGARRGVLSLASMVASTLAVKGVRHDGRQQPASNWLCALNLGGDRWAYCAVRDDNFLPNGDFAGSRSEVLERLHGDYAMGGWNAVVGDAEIEAQGFHNFNPATVDDFLPGASRGRLWLASAWELKPVDPPARRKAVLAVAAGLACLAAGAGYWAWQREQAAGALREQQAQAARDRLAAQAARVVVQPWAGKPMPREFARACASTPTLLAPGGWTLDEYSCTSDRATYTWSRGASSVAHLLEQVPQAQIDLGGDKASLTRPIVAAAGSAEPLLESRAVLWPLLSRFQELGLKLRLAAAAPLAPPLPGMARGPSSPPAWTAYPMSLQSGGLPPVELAGALTQPGVRIERATYKQGDWSIEGVIYAK